MASGPAAGSGGGGWSLEGKVGTDHRLICLLTLWIHLHIQRTGATTVLHMSKYLGDKTGDWTHPCSMATDGNVWSSSKGPEPRSNEA